MPSVWDSKRVLLVDGLEKKGQSACPLETIRENQGDSFWKAEDCSNKLDDLKI